MKYIWRMIQSALGGVVFGIGVVFVMRSGLGYSAWDVLHEGLAQQTGIMFGNMSIIVGFVMIALDFCLKEAVGLGTFLSMIFAGKSVDVVRLFFPEFHFSHYPVYYLTMAAGMFVSAVGTYIYMSAGLGTGARDGLMVAVRRHLKIPIGLSRFVLEMMACLVGWLLGGPVGPATFIMSATMGSAIQIVFRIFHYETNSAQHDNVFDSYKRLKAYLSGGTNPS